MDTDGLEKRIGYRFKKAALLTQALTHRSHGQPNNERLEFLGDSVLNCAIATVLYERFEDVDEGDLSRSRAFLVKQQSLYRVAQRLALGEYLVLGEGESRSGGTRRPSILADALEALIGAVYCDGGFEKAKDLISRLYEPELTDANPRTLGKDAKTLLQEELQRSRMPLPVYDVVATHGAAHNQVFDVECVISRLDVRVLGTGGSRRAAEQAAAENALQALSAADKSNASKPAPRKKARRAGAKASRAKSRARQSSAKTASANGAAKSESNAGANGAGSHAPAAAPAEPTVERAPGRASAKAKSGRRAPGSA